VNVTYMMRVHVESSGITVLRELELFFKSILELNQLQVF
jgi:hypothetical protein